MANRQTGSRRALPQGPSVLAFALGASVGRLAPELAQARTWIEQGASWAAAEYSRIPSPGDIFR